MKPYPQYEVDPINNLKALVDYCAEKHGDKTAFSWMRGDKTCHISFSRFQSDVNTLGTYFIDNGFHNDKIAILGENSYEWIVTFFAVANSGNVIVPIDKEFCLKEMAALLEHSDARVLIYSETFAEKIEAFRKNSKIELFIEAGTGVPEIISKAKQNDQGKMVKIPIDDNQLCAIYYTSGTTGKPKGVMLSHKNLASNTVNACRNFLSQGHSVLFLPLSHTFSLVACLFGQLYYGNTNVINDDIKNISKEMAEFKPWLLFAVPLFIETMHKRIWDSAKTKKKDKQLRILMLLSDALCKIGIDRRRQLFREVLASLGGSLEIIICGGAPLEKKMIQEFRSFGIEILNGYGITECSPIVSVNRNRYNKHGSSGPVIPCCEVKIVDGEIWVRGDSVMLGYYKDPQATQEAFSDGWFKTGDLGYLDEDGFLYVTGRKKNLILLSNGYNVCPEELEEQIKKIDGVAEVMVYQDNNKIIAEIYPDLAIAGAQGLIKQSIDNLNVTLPKHKRIGEVKFRESEFEKTSTKKIKRHIAKI